MPTLTSEPATATYLAIASEACIVPGSIHTAHHQVRLVSAFATSDDTGETNNLNRRDRQDRWDRQDSGTLNIWDREDGWDRMTGERGMATHHQVWRVYADATDNHTGRKEQSQRERQDEMSRLDRTKSPGKIGRNKN